MALGQYVIHIDTSILIAMLKRGGYRNDVERAALRLRERVKKHGHTKLKISLPVLGELVLYCLREQDSSPLEELINLKGVLGERLELGAIHKFRGTSLDFHDVLRRLLEADDHLRDNPTDAIIVALAIMDPEVDVLKMNDPEIVLSRRLKEEVSRLRRELGFKKLKIEPLGV